MKLDEKDYLAHYGILRKSGRYPWGSGGNQNTRNKMFLDTIKDLRDQGIADKDIAKMFSTPERRFTTNDLRQLTTIAGQQQRAEKIRTAQRLRDKGMSPTAIGKKMGLNESSVRVLLDDTAKHRNDILVATSDMLRQQVEEKDVIDVGTDVHRDLPLGDKAAGKIGITSTKFDTAVAALREEGYRIHYVPVKQLGTGHFTTRKVLAKPEVKWKELVDDPGRIKLIQKKSDDGGQTWKDDLFQTPIAISPKRVAVRYGPEGGAEADGVIYVRPGAKDLSMGGKRYAQVRIQVGPDHYLKGMAVQKDDLPPGVDLLFNTNKGNTGNKLDAMKKLNDDPDLPFGSVVSQHRDPKTNKVNSAMNIVNDEGDWDKWSRNLPSQMLSKQSPALAKQQLDLTFERREREFRELSALTHPTVRKKLLDTFAEETDSAAVHLKAAAMPKQATRVILPIKSIKENEIYAPGLEDGTRVALVRFPHGGTFEIPQVTVNNKNREAKLAIGTGIETDAIGIHHKVAERLSGADFDGDTVLVIPNDRGQVKSQPALEGLKNFDPKDTYRPYDGMKTVDGGTYNAKTRSVDYGVDSNGVARRPNKGAMQQKMGDVSNLITDMTIKGANNEELARAVRHSMVIIDSEKHHLDYKASHQDNGIPSLKEKYQGAKRAGASTIISRASSPQHIRKRKPRPAAEGGPVDRTTGKKVFVDAGEAYVNKKGEKVFPKMEVERLALTDDAFELVSKGGGTPVERVYAEHSNRLKALANQARKESVNTKNPKMSSSAKQVYKTEVQSLLTKLDTARKNAPLERQAQSLANSVVAQRKAANPHLEKSEIKKIEAQALAQARVRTGAKKERITLTQREWDAIQAGAVSTNTLEKIMREADLDSIRQFATPKVKVLMDSGNVTRARSMLARGFTQAEVARQLGVSLTTLKTSLSEG